LKNRNALVALTPHHSDQLAGFHSAEVLKKCIAGTMELGGDFWPHCLANSASERALGVKKMPRKYAPHFSPSWRS